MTERWVGKIEATTCFKVTERTLDNWVKAGRIKKARRNGQIMYEISSALEERANEESFENTYEHTQKTEEKPPIDEEPEENENATEILILEARLEEKTNQIQQLRETIDGWENKNTPMLLRSGQLLAKTELLALETESLRKEKEKLENDYRTISERSFSKRGVFIFVLTVLVLLSAIGSVLFWKFSEKENDLKYAVETLEQKLKSEVTSGQEKVKEVEEKLGAKNESLFSEILKTKEEWKTIHEELSSEKMKVSAEVQKASEANRKLSEQEIRFSELRNDTEKLRKTIEKLQIENNQYNIQLKVMEATQAAKPKEPTTEKDTTKKPPVEEIRFLKNAEEN